jgi:hypothetical protein
MTLLSNPLAQGGHLDEAQSLIVEADALHQRLTGGVNDEGIGLAVRCSTICALRHLARADSPRAPAPR